MKLKKNQLILGALNVAFFFAGLEAAFFLNLGLSPLSFNFHPAFDFFVLSIGVFVLSALFSGYLSPLVFLYIGAASSNYLESNPLGAGIMVVPFLLTSYAGSIAGFYSTEDMNEKENFFEHKKEILTFFIAGIAAAVAAGFLFAILAQIDQSGLLVFQAQGG